MFTELVDGEEELSYVLCRGLILVRLFANPTIENINVFVQKVDSVILKLHKEKTKGVCRSVKNDYTTIVTCPICEFRLKYSYKKDTLSVVRDRDVMEDTGKENPKQVCDTLARVLTKYAKENSVQLNSVFTNSSFIFFYS